jgi:hypothetical protein
MYRWIPGGVAAIVLSTVSAAAAQGPIVDIKDLRPRETRSVVFRLASTQDLKIMAVGADAEHHGTFSWVRAMWPSPPDAPKDPWIGNAWILDLSTRRVIWELSAVTTTRGPRNTQIFSGPVRLPPGTYEAFYAAFPSFSIDNDNGDGNAAAQFVNWLNDEGFDTFRLTVDGSAQPLTGADADRARHAFVSDAIVNLRAIGKEEFLQAGFVLNRPTEVEGTPKENVARTPSSTAGGSSTPIRVRSCGSSRGVYRRPPAARRRTVSRASRARCLPDATRRSMRQTIHTIRARGTRRRRTTRSRGASCCGSPIPQRAPR